MATLSVYVGIINPVLYRIFFFVTVNDMKRSVFVIIEHSQTGHVLCVMDAHNEVSLPGGKAELKDRNQFATLHREFQEEIGVRLPHRNYKHFQWGDRHHTIRIYYVRVSSDVADKLCRIDETKTNDDPNESIVSFRWVPPLQTKKMKHHVRHALRIWAKVDTRN